MVSWRSPEVEALCLDIYVRLVLFFVGIYCYYFCLSLPAVEIPLICRKLKFSFAHVPYIIGRWGTLTGAMLMFVRDGPKVVPSINPSGRLSALFFPDNASPYCSKMIKAMPILASLVIACSSTNIMLRPFALFRRNTYIMCVLMLFLLVHWTAVLVGIISIARLKTGSEPTTDACTEIEPDNSQPNYLIIAFYLYTVIWDFIILLFTIIGLSRQMPTQPSPLWLTLYRQGIGYLVATVAMNIPMLVFTFLNLNGTMNVMFATPGGMVSVMASSAAVASLLRSKEERNPIPLRDRPRNDARLNPDAMPKGEAGGGVLLTSHVAIPFISEGPSARNHHASA